MRISHGDLGGAQVHGSKSGLATFVYDDEHTCLEDVRYLVSMLGKNPNWVRNLKAASGRAVLCHGRREAIHLEEVDPSVRAPILRRYLQVAPGARPHIPVDRRAPLAEFQRIARDYPVFRVRAELASEGGT